MEMDGVRGEGDSNEAKGIFNNFPVLKVNKSTTLRSEWARRN